MGFGALYTTIQTIVRLHVRHRRGASCWWGFPRVLPADGSDDAGRHPPLHLAAERQVLQYSHHASGWGGSLLGGIWVRCRTSCSYCWTPASSMCSPPDSSETSPTPGPSTCPMPSHCACGHHRGALDAVQTPSMFSGAGQVHCPESGGEPQARAHRPSSRSFRFSSPWPPRWLVR